MELSEEGADEGADELLVLDAKAFDFQRLSVYLRKFGMSFHSHYKLSSSPSRTCLVLFSKKTKSSLSSVRYH